MQITVLKERMPGETRVAATPDTVKKLVAAGHSVVVESGAGVQAAAPDALYVDAGARIAPEAATAVAGSSLVLKVRGPQIDEIDLLPTGCAVVALFFAWNYPHFAALQARHIDAWALELMPRTSRAQAMDVLSSQANIGGYRAVLLATQYYARFMPMMMTAAGTAKAARVLILGAGVAGLQAIATARRLGAVVEAFDVRPAAREQVMSLGAKFVEVPLTEEEKAQSDGVYAKEMSADYKARQAELIDKHARSADIIISTALIPGRPAPRLLHADTVRGMKPGSVIIDMAVEMGGNCELSRLDEVVIEHDVTILGPRNLPALVAADASALYARNVLNFLQLLLPREGGLSAPDLSDDILAATLVTHKGELRFGTP